MITPLITITPLEQSIRIKNRQTYVTILHKQAPHERSLIHIMDKPHFMLIIWCFSGYSVLLHVGKTAERKDLRVGIRCSIRC